MDDDRELAIMDVILYSTIGCVLVTSGIISFNIAYNAHKWLKEDQEFLKEVEDTEV